MIQGQGFNYRTKFRKPAILKDNMPFRPDVGIMARIKLDG